MRCVFSLAVLLLTAVLCTAQPIDEPLPRAVVDAYGFFGGLPASSGWVPAVSAQTPVPHKGFGVAAGAHVYLLKLGLATFGVGASLLKVSAKGDPSALMAASTAPALEIPVVTTRVTSLVPQLSLNFGHRRGWSYVSAGYGSTRIDSRADAVGSLPALAAPDRWNPAINFGGGARWFMKRRLAAGFDLRFTKLSSRATMATQIGAKRAQLVNLLVGISLQ
jgi:hypothetical protein